MTHTNSNLFPYTKKQMIGSGGTAIVYLAEDWATGEDVAIKLIAKKVSAEPKFRGRFEREIAMLKAVSHPNILPILNHGETKDGQIFIAMPYISGGSVRDLLKDGAISWEQTLNIMEQVCPALDAMHEMGFIHRDIKPHNILIGEDGNVMLSDFGISRPIEATQDNSVTHTLDIVGTPEFIAPEQAADGELSAQTDIYQLGVTAFYMLTGERLFNGSALQVIAKHIGEKPGSAGDLVDGLPRNIDAVLHMALAKEPKNRFRTASDFLGALQLLGDQNTVTFQHLPGFPLRVAAPAPEAAVYEAVVPAASGRGVSAQSQNTITPSAAPAPAKKRRPIVRYAIAGLGIAALIIGGFFFIPGAPGGGGGRGDGGGGNGGRGGQGNAADTAPTLVEGGNALQEDALVLNNIDNSVTGNVAVTESEAELPQLANDTGDTLDLDTETVVEIASALADTQVSAPGNPDPAPAAIPVNNPAPEPQDDTPAPQVAADNNDGNGNGDRQRGNGQGDNNNNGNDGQNGNGNGNNDGRGNGNGGNGNPNGRGGNDNGQGRGNGNGQGRGNGEGN